MHLLYSLIFRGTSYCHINKDCLHRLVVCSSTSDQSTFVEPKVNLLIKDTQSKRHWAKLNRSSRRSAPINPNGAPAEWSKLWTTWSTPAPSSELDDKTIKWLEKTDIPVWIGKNYHTNDDCFPRGTCYCHQQRFLHRLVVSSSTSDQPTFVKPIVKLLKDTQIVTKTTSIQKRSGQCVSFSPRHGLFFLDNAEKISPHLNWTVVLC